MEKTIKVFKFLSVLILSLNLAGCVTSRSHFHLDIPAEKTQPSNGKQIYIRSIVDQREFQDNPPTADIPSLGHGGLRKAGPEIRSRAIGRKRNSFGKALGDILLNEDQTVNSVIYEATRNSLKSLGYEITDKKEEVRPDALTMDISIDKFWAWFAPGFWALNLKSDITTTNKITSLGAKDQTRIVEVHAVESFQAATDKNWKKTIETALRYFSEQAEYEFRKIDTGR